MTNKKRCEWCGTDSLYQKYHDEEWGVTKHNQKNTTISNHSSFQNAA